MASPRLIAIDMDGTLLGSDGRVSARNSAALLEAEAAGVQVVIATGRRHGYAMGVLRELGLRASSVVVSSNGTVTRTHDAQLVHRHHMPLATARWLCSHAADFRNTLVLTFDTVTTDGNETVGALVMEQPNELQNNIGRWMDANRPVIRTVEAIEEVLETNHRHGPPIQAMLCGPVARMRAAEARLLEHPGVLPVGASSAHETAELTLHRTEYPERDLCIVDILPAGCSKATALARLTASQDIHSSEILAIGDNWNDLPMLEFAGQAVVMANAPEDLLAHARSRGWSIGLSNDEDGVAHAIELALRPMAAAIRS
jgi:hydroxymethylpyrimidine pyrophosphatase-like HAD family hydrolase